jgi:hypothetical protein
MKQLKVKGGSLLLSMELESFCEQFIEWVHSSPVGVEYEGNHFQEFELAPLPLGIF